MIGQSTAYRLSIAYAREAYRNWLYTGRTRVSLGHVTARINLENNSVDLTGLPEGSRQMPFRSSWQ